MGRIKTNGQQQYKPQEGKNENRTWSFPVSLVCSLWNSSPFPSDNHRPTYHTRNVICNINIIQNELLYPNASNKFDTFYLPRLNYFIVWSIVILW